MTFIYLLAMGVILYFVILIPRGRLTDNYDVFIAADPKTVWDTYFIHVRGSDYRPGTRVVGFEVLSSQPLTVRITVKANFLPVPLSIVETFELYEPYTRYKLRDGIASAEVQRKVNSCRSRVEHDCASRLPLLNADCCFRGGRAAEWKGTYAPFRTSVKAARPKINGTAFLIQDVISRNYVSTESRILRMRNPMRNPMS